MKKTEINNLAITLNILYAKNEEIYSVYLSNYNSNRKKQVILLMISSREKWNYTDIKNYEE